MPHPDDHPPDIVHMYRTAIGLGEEEYSIVSTAYRAQAGNGELL